MVVQIQHLESGIKKENFQVIDNFVKFLNKIQPVPQNLIIQFTGQRVGEMTTGSRSDYHIIKIFTKNRLLIDILRTLAHEWTHEFEDDVLDIHNIQDIGGKNENIANISAGIILKLFEKKYPEYEVLLYN